MKQIPWYVTAIGAALVWGIHYPLIENALRRVSLVSVLVLTAFPIVLLVPFFAEALAADLRTLASMAMKDRVPVFSLALTSLAASVLLFLSIESKNATLASLIEITYPLFVALFAYLLFRQLHLSPSVLLGGLLILAGAALIIVNNP